MWAVRSGSDFLILDCGFAFPTEEMFGIDLVLPDYSVVLENQQDLRGIYISHGHEDHIGGLPYLLKQLDVIVPIYATPLTAGLIEAKLKEHAAIRGKFPIQVVRPRDIVDAGNCKVEYIRVTHSIPDACSIAVHTPAGTVIYTGDWKMDQTPVDGQHFDFYKFAELGEKGVLLLLSDSTNATREGFTPSERMVEMGLDGAFATAKNRIIVSTFASNVHRVQIFCNLAQKYGRKVALVGRSLLKVADQARKHGFLTVPDGLLIKIDEATNLPHDQVVIVTTGSQGEPTSGLTRIANHQHKHINVVAGDTVILSAIPIPGNERTVSRVINTLFEHGAHVVYETSRSTAPGATKHVSGHASREEMRIMLTLTKPKFFVPIHGEERHLIRHAELAESVGIQPDHILIPANGDIMEFNAESCKVVGQFNADPVLVDGSALGVGMGLLKDRKTLANEGVVSAVVTVDEEGFVLDGPELLSQGFIHHDEFADLLDDAREAIVASLMRCREEGALTSEALNRRLKEDIGRFLYERTRRRPAILAMVQVVRSAGVSSVTRSA
jgi:ribonuclease J